MPEYLYLLTLGLFLGTIVVVFGMKYFATLRQAQSRLTADGAYRDLADRAVAVQSHSATALSAIHTELAEVKARLASVEKILKAVE